MNNNWTDSFVYKLYFKNYSSIDLSVSIVFLNKIWTEDTSLKAQGLHKELFFFQNNHKFFINIQWNAFMQHSVTGGGFYPVYTKLNNSQNASQTTAYRECLQINLIFMFHC